MQQKTDEELVLLAQSGNKEAFDLLIGRYQPLAWRIARNVISHEEIARELIQEAWLTAYLCLHQLREAILFRGWLSRIVLNTCRSYLRTSKPSDLSLEACDEAIDILPFTSLVDDPEAMVEAQEQQYTLLDAIRSLSSKDALATVLFYYEQYRIQDIALLLGISVTAVKSRLFKARRQLRVLLAPPSTYEPERQGTLRGGNTMVSVVIEGVRKSLLTEQRVVTLLDQAGRRFMNVRVPRVDALTIAMNVYGITQPYLTPIHFMARTLQSLHVTLEEVQIRLLSGGIFYAVTRMRQGEIVQEGDAKPGEALGLALLMKAPIVVAEEVLEQMGMVLPDGKTFELFWAEEVLKTIGITLPEEKTLQMAYGRQRGRDAVLKEVTQLAQAMDEPAPSTFEELEQTKQQIGDFQKE